MRKIIQKASIALLCLSMLGVSNTFAQESSKTVSLEDIVKFDASPIQKSVNSIQDIVQYIDIKGAVLDTIENHEELSEKIMSSDFSELNEAIANSFVEKVEIAQPARKRNYAFAWGNCTYYVANNKNVTWSGNARDWLKNAKAAGESIGHTPKPGAIIVFIGGGYSHYGHVGIVHRVNPDGTLYISDMNYSGLNKITYRTIKQNKAIAGYIYVD